MQRRVLPGLLSVAVLLSSTVCRAGDGWHSDGLVDGVQVEHRDVADAFNIDMRLALRSPMFPSGGGNEPVSKFADHLAPILMGHS